jgi:hypothetical protein
MSVVLLERTVPAKRLEATVTVMSTHCNLCVCAISLKIQQRFITFHHEHSARLYVYLSMRARCGVIYKENKHTRMPERSGRVFLSFTVYFLSFYNFVSNALLIFPFAASGCEESSSLFAHITHFTALHLLCSSSFVMRMLQLLCSAINNKVRFCLVFITSLPSASFSLIKSLLLRVHFKDSSFMTLFFSHSALEGHK